MSAYSRVGPEEAHRTLEEKGVGQLVDVRETMEIDALRVEGALNLPLSRLDALADRVDRGRPVFLLCRSGARAAKAAEKLHALGVKDIRVIDGGIEAWAGAGKPVIRGTSRVWSLERQVRFIAGSLVIVGTTLGLMVNFKWLFLALFVGCGLVFAAVTDICTMALILAKLPWNKGSCGR